jgi:hypothetical protein
LARIELNPEQAEFWLGEQGQFTALGYDTQGNPVEITPWWTTTGGEISPEGLYTASQAGEFVITAQQPGSEISGNAKVLVNLAAYMPTQTSVPTVHVPTELEQECDSANILIGVGVGIILLSHKRKKEANTPKL